jgi:hypothetical protein
MRRFCTFVNDVYVKIIIKNTIKLQQKTVIPLPHKGRRVILP